MLKKQKILLVTTSFPIGPGDYSGSFIREYADETVRQGYDLTVICPDALQCDPAFDQRHPYQIVRVRYFWPRQLQRLAYGDGMPDNLHRSWWARLQAPCFCLALMISTLKRARRCDLLHAHWIIPGGLVAVIARFFVRKPIVLTVHSSDYWLLVRRGFGKWLLRQLLRCVQSVSVVSPSVHAHLSKLPQIDQSKIHLIPMGIRAPQVFTTQTQVPCTAHEKPPIKLLYFGRLIPIKGVDLLIQAMQGLPQTELNIAGWGSQTGILKRLAKQTGGNIKFLGALGHQAKQRVLQACDICVLPSSSSENGYEEGLPVAMLEAMSYGKAILASRTGGMGTFLNSNQDALLVKPSSIPALREGLQTLFKDRALRERLGYNAQKRAQAYFWHTLYPQYDRLYNEALRS